MRRRKRKKKKKKDNCKALCVTRKRNKFGLGFVTAQKIKFSIKDFSSKYDPQFSADLVTFTREILNGKLHFLCSMSGKFVSNIKQIN